MKDFFRAVKNGDEARVREMVLADPGLVKAAEADGSTGLHYAAWKGHPAIALVLLENGADVMATNENGHWGTTALHAAAHANNANLVELLIEHGAQIDAPDINGKTPLAHTAIHKATAAAKVLQRHGAT